jgi:cytosine/adenosine deaminase-related metal-dependent hydrolase
MTLLIFRKLVPIKHTMRKFSADYVFPISGAPIPNGVVTIDDDGTIVDVSSASAADHASSDIQQLKGILCPGFVNTHCHLELSHLRAQVSENKGMTGFITELIGKRGNFSEEEIQQKIATAEQEMICNGIVAVGDISNNNSTFKQKAKGNLAYHTFIEIFSMDPSKAEQVYLAGKKLEEELIQNNQPSTISNHASVSPHAPYTMSVELLNLINEDAKKNKNIITIHNQESEGENQLFESNSGVMYETFKSMGINPAFMRKTGQNALASTLPYLKDAKKILLVHNTFTTKEDLLWIKSNASNLISQIYFCTCPNANIYIENKLPNYALFITENCKVTIGTDSLASNWSLSVLDELKTISKHHPEIELNMLLTWATKNGAEFLEFNQLGTLEKGKKPGLNLLKNTDGMKLTEKTNVLKIV